MRRDTDTRDEKENGTSDSLLVDEESGRFLLLSRICAAFVACIGLVALLGWVLGFPLLASLGAGLIPVAPSTAVFFVLYAIAVFLRAYLPLHRGTYWISFSINLTGAIIALLLLILSYRGIRLDAEHLGFTVNNVAGEIPRGYMSPVTALCFLLASLSFMSSLLSSPRRSRLSTFAWWLAFLIIMLSLVLVLAYLYGEPLLYGSPFIPPALLTSIAFTALGAALLVLAGPRIGLFRRQAESAVRASHAVFLIFIILAAGVVTAGYFSYKRYEKNYRTEVEHQLSAVADLKVNEIVNWRKERLSDASLFYRNANFYARAKRYFDRPQDADAKEELRTWLLQIRETHQYDRVCVLDAQGRARLSVPEEAEPTDPFFSKRAVEVLRTGQITFADLFRDKQNGRVYLSVLSPIVGGGHGSDAIGVLVMRIDPEEYLYPFIKQWPTPSSTAETLLVRREGNDVLFLNDLRFRKNSALTLRSPLTHTEMPAVQAALGRKGIVVGRDYRGVHVLADVRAVPGSPWFLVARMDVSEIYAPLKERLWMIVAFVVVLLLGAGAGVGLVWRQQSVLFYRQRYEAAEALRESEDRFRLLVEGVRDYAIIMLDPSGNVMSWGRGAERINGYREDEIVGRNFSCFYPEEDIAQGRHLLELQEASSNGRFEDEGFRKRKDGTRFWANVVITALRDKSGRLRGFSKITRDISEQKRTQREREITIEFLQLVNDCSGTKDLIEATATFFQRQSGCEAVGIRLHEGMDYPYFEARGFPKEFVLMENSLCARDSAGNVLSDETGNPVIECMCGNVIRGRFDPSKPFFTAHGSFWTNNTTELLRSTTEADRQSRTRNRCNGEGYESVALIPLRVGGQRLGLLQLNDRRKGVFSEETIASWERLADYFSVSLAKFRTEDDLRSSEHRFRSLFDNMLEGFAYCRMLYEDNRPQDFVYLSVNGAFEKLTGLKNVIGKKITEVVPGIKEANPELFEVYDRVVTTGRPERFETYSTAFGGWLYISVYSTEKEHFIAVFDNISVRKRTEEALRNSEEKYRTLVDNASVGIYKASLEGRFLYVNAALATAFEFDSPEDMMSENVPVRYKNPEDRAFFLDQLKKNGRVDNYELDTLSKTGKAIHLLISSTLDGDIISGMVLNVTEQRKLEAQLRHAQKMEAIGTLAGGIAHDFNNILNVIVGYGSMVIDRMEPNSPSKMQMNEVLAAADRAANLTKRLLTFSRKQVMEMKPVNVNETILGIAKMLSRIIGEDIVFKTELTDKKIIVMADSGQLEQVMVNLVSNARDAMPKGGRLTISTGIKQVDDEYIAAYGYGKTGTYALISVTDTGTGIHADTQKKIFEPFFTTKGVGEGTGLGLAIAYGIIKQHNGYIKVYSEEGRGTSFKILLPLSEEETSKEREDEAVAPIKGGTETILIAEDDVALRKLSRIVLESFGYEVIIAEDGEAAIGKYIDNQDKVRLVILDMIMPKKSGKEARDEIRKVNPHIKTLFVSGYTMDIISRQELLDEGIDFILKPVSPKDLLKKVREVLDR